MVWRVAWYPVLVHTWGGDLISKNYIFGVAAAVLLTATLVITGVLVGSNLSAGNSGASSPVVSPVTATNAAKKAGASAAVSPVSSSQSIAIPGFEKMVMKAGQTRQTVKLYNPETNACYFMITLSLSDGTPLYRSGLIKPGQVVDAIEISRSLQAGTYANAILQYDCYSSDGLQQLNGAQSVFNLEVVP